MHFHVTVIEPPTNDPAGQRNRIGALCSTREALEHEVAIERQAVASRQVGWRECSLPCFGVRP